MLSTAQANHSSDEQRSDLPILTEVVIPGHLNHPRKRAEVEDEVDKHRNYPQKMETNDEAVLLGLFDGDPEREGERQIERLAEAKAGYKASAILRQEASPLQSAIVNELMSALPKTLTKEDEDKLKAALIKAANHLSETRLKVMMAEEGKNHHNFTNLNLRIDPSSETRIVDSEGPESPTQLFLSPLSEVVKEPQSVRSRAHDVGKIILPASLKVKTKPKAPISH